MKIGILALQGSFAEHAKILEKIGTEFLFVHTKLDLEEISKLIIPGGESTTLEKLLKKFEMWEEIQLKIKNEELKIMGTCAGAILCAKFGARWEVDRNGFGAQQSSFSTILNSEKFPDFRGVFIRAPRFEKINPAVEILAKFQKDPVLLRGGNFLGASFHPEISGDPRVHEFFLEKF